MIETAKEEIKTGYKLTKLGWIPEGWDYLQLKKLINLQSGLHLNPTDYNSYKEGIPYFTGPTDFTNSYENITKWTNKSNAIAKSGEVLMTVKGAGVGRLFKLKLPKVAIGRQIMSLKGELLDNTYLYYQLIKKKQFFEKLASGNMIPGLSRKDILNNYIPVPELPEQKAIAQIFSTWDKAIEKLTLLIEQKELKKKALMQQLLTGKRRFKEFKGEWKEVYLHDIFKRITRKNDEKNTNVVTISAKRGLIRQDTFFKKNIASEILDNYYLLKKEEFAYNKSYSNGYPMGAIKRLKLYDKAVVTTLYICFDVKDPAKTSRHYFEHFFEAGYLNRGLTKIAHEGGRAHGLLNVTPGDFFNLKIEVPSFDEQKKIATVINAAEKELQLLKKKLDDLKEQKKGLMQQLLTGKKRIKSESTALSK